MRKTKGAAAEAAWNEKFAAYEAAHPELAAEFKRRMAGDLPADWADKADAFVAECNDEGQVPGYPQGVPERLSRPMPLHCRNCSAAPPISVART